MGELSWTGLEIGSDRAENKVGQEELGGTAKNNEANRWILRQMRGVLGRTGGRMLE